MPKEENFELRPGQKIGDKARIPDEDMVAWIKTLMEDDKNPLSPQEIDEMMLRLNFEFSRQKMSPMARQVLDETMAAWDPILKRGKLTEQEKENLRDHILAAEREAMERRGKNPQAK